MQLDEDEFVLTYDENSVSLEQILDACEGAGFPASIVMEESPSRVPKDSLRAPDLSEWPDFLQRAAELANSQNKPLIIEFGADWCAPCRRMESETFTDPVVQSLLRDTILVKVDTDEHPRVAGQFGVAGIPDVRFLSPSGEELEKSLGFTDAQMFATLVSKSIEAVQSQSVTPVPVE